MQTLLLIVTFLPMLAGLGLLLIPNREESLPTVRTTALWSSVATFVLSLFLLPSFQSEAGLQFALNVPWIPQWGVNFHIAVDGISIWLVLLNTLLFPLAILTSFQSVRLREKMYYILLLLLETAVTGVFLAQDIILFYVFFEATLIPMYFLIGIWGGAKRLYATTKFVLYTMVGSLLMLGAIIGLYVKASAAGLNTFDIPTLVAAVGNGTLVLEDQFQFWAFLAFFLAFAIKVPLFPLHTWLPDAHTEAPTAGSIILAGVLLKMGTYGFIRMAIPLFPKAPYIQFGPVGLADLQSIIMALSVVGIIYGALVAAVQVDVKRLVAYSSVAHMGFIMLGLFSFNQIAVDGAILQMVNHGISTGALFMLVGFIYERRHTRLIDNFGGLAAVMPVYYTYFLIIMLSSVGLPALNGFVGEFLILLGSFQEDWLMTLIATLGVILAAVYLLFMFRRMFFGEITNAENRNLKDLNMQELVAITPLAVLTLVIGLFPSLMFRFITPSSEAFVEIATSHDEDAFETAMQDIHIDDGQGGLLSVSIPGGAK
ncbi:NADH-quinone oxidoreductase subunit M [bacterium]|nr:NADH-quinone oxidoreductase subunit M [bacterium]